MKNIYTFLISILIFTTGLDISAQTFDPARGATGVSISPVITITFAQGSTIEFGTNNSICVGTSWTEGDYIEMKTSGRNGPDPRLSINDNVLTIDLSGETLDYNAEYFVSSWDHNVLIVNGSNWDNLYDDTYYRFTTVSPPPPPVIQTYDPAQNATDVPINKTLALTFDQNIKFNTDGTFHIKILDADNNVFGDYRVENGTPDAPLSISGVQLLIDPPTDLAAQTTYYVLIDADVIQADDDEANFGGISSDTEWRFTTPAPPITTSMLPADGSTTVRLTDTLVVTFNENIVKGSGNVVIYNGDDDSDFETIGINNANITVVDNKLYIVHSKTFEQDGSYYVFIDNGFVKSSSNNVGFAGISDKTEWNFTTVKVRDWEGGTSTDWTDSNNWGSTGGFVNGAVVNILNTSTYYPVISSGSNVEIADLIIDDGAGITIKSGATVTVDNIIELRSTVNANAYLLCNGTLNYNPENMKIYQNIKASDRWYYVSSPVKNATGCSIGCVGEIWYWNNALGKWEMGDLNDTMNVGQGYTLWSNNDLIFTGEINTGNVAVNIDYGNSVGCNLIGNPYTNSINWNNVQLSSDSIFNGFWLYKNLDAIYGSYNGNTGIGTNLELDSIIPSNHNFWVRLDTTVSETVTFTSACKTTTTGSYLKSALIETKFPVFKFAATNGANRDEIVISFANPAEIPLRKLDMTKLFTYNTDYIQPYFTSGNKKLCMKGLPEFTSEITVPFALRIDTAIKVTSFAINKILIENFPDDIVILLHDKKTGQYTDLVSENSYSFTETSKGDITDRFEFVFKGDLATEIKDIKAPNKEKEDGVYLVSGDKQFTLYINNTESSDVKVYNLSGQVVKDMKDISSGKVIEVPVRGIYVVQIKQDGKTISKKVFVK